MARMSQWIGLAVLSFGLVGCVSQEKYAALKMDRDQLAERLGLADSQYQGAVGERDAYKNQRDAMLGGTNNKDAMIANLSAQNADLQRQYEALTRQYEDAVKNTGNTVMLPQPLTNALTQFASTYPDLVDFDSTRGIVKFKSDITFTTGSAEVTDRARQAIDRFAQILNSSAAVGYELQVAGHTDNQRVQNPRTIASGHKDNWYLSAHRAIAVAEVLQRNSVSSSRLAVVGYADQHPIADNGSEAGRASNRRVEVLILPTTVHGATLAHHTIPANGAHHSVPKVELNKDTAIVDHRSALNK